MIKRTTDKRYVSAFLIVAIVTMLISPFCHTKSSAPNIIEICTAYGVEWVSLIDGQPIQAPNNSKHAQQAAECAFCFSNANTQAIENATMTIDSPHLSKQSAGNFVSHLVILNIRKQQSKPRAPPSLS